MANQPFDRKLLRTSIPFPIIGKKTYVFLEKEGVTYKTFEQFFPREKEKK